jgi:hypothetical protein
MAGSPIRRARREAGEDGPVASEAIRLFKNKVHSWLPSLADKMLELANGIQVQMGSGDEAVVYSRPPDYRAISYLMDRVMGKAAVEVNEDDARLNRARAVYLEQQVLEGLISAQRRELDARAGKAEMELSMWPKQFVTEEEQMADIQALAKAVNTGWLSMTPEKFAEICPGVEDPSGALERLRGLVGREQAQIIGQVLGSRAEKPSSEEE